MSNPELRVLAEEGCCGTPPLTQPVSESDAIALAQSFKALGDPVRLRLLSLIASRAGQEVCVCDLLDAFTRTAPTISHHLKVLRDAGLITGERRASWVYYRVVPSALAALSQLLDVSAMTTAADA